MLSQALRGEAVSIKEPSTADSGAVTVSSIAMGLIWLLALCGHSQSLYRSAVLRWLGSEDKTPT
jgi:hypothetical protein